jgi:hypothetical protein
VVACIDEAATGQESADEQDAGRVNNDEDSPPRCRRKRGLGPEVSTAPA